MVGYVLIYQLEIEDRVYPKKEERSKSKIDFIYQQF